MSEDTYKIKGTSNNKKIDVYFKRLNAARICYLNYIVSKAIKAIKSLFRTYTRNSICLQKKLAGKRHPKSVYKKDAILNVPKAGALVLP